MKWRHTWVVCCCLPARRARASLATADCGYTVAAILTCKARRRKPNWTVKHKPHSLERDGHWPSKLTFVFHALNRRSHKAAYLSVFTYLLRSNSEITRKKSDVNVERKQVNVLEVKFPACWDFVFRKGRKRHLCQVILTKVLTIGIFYAAKCVHLHVIYSLNKCFCLISWVL